MPGCSTFAAFAPFSFFPLSCRDILLCDPRKVFFLVTFVASVFMSGMASWSGVISLHLWRDGIPYVAPLPLLFVVLWKTSHEC